MPLTLRRRLAFPVAAVLLTIVSPRLGAAQDETPSNAWSKVATPLPGPARVVGGVAHGCIAGAQELPPDGAGYEVIRLSRHRDFGHPDLLAFIQRLGRRTAAEGLPAFYVGDMAQPRGGPLPFGHASHQTGIDVDIWFNMTVKKWIPPRARETVDLPSMLLANYRAIDPRQFGSRQIALLKTAASDPAVERIFVNPVIKAALCRSAIESSVEERSWLERIRPWYGHDDHFHVRLRCPASSPECEEQQPVPPGDGCGVELASWLRHLPPRPPEHAVERRPLLPASCSAILTAP
jgi:penicillin-insensitive murein DD-endopeptidase